MKKIFFFILIFVSFQAFSQVRQPQTLGSPSTDVYSRGTIGSDSGLVFRRNFPDTLHSTIGSIRNIPNLLLVVNGKLLKRDPTATFWEQMIGSLDTSTMLSTYLNDVGYGLLRTGKVARFDSATVFAQLRATISSGTTITYPYTTLKYLNGYGNFSTFKTDSIPEGSLNLYFTNARFDTRFSLKSTSDLTEGSNLYWTPSRFDTRLATKTTTDLTEGSNLYYTNTRARAAISLTTTGSGAATYNNTTGAFNIPTPSVGGGFAFDSLSMISITSYPGVSVQWTTGNISSSSTTLTVVSAKDFAIGQWITVEGAGAAGVNLRTTITNVSGTTITLNNAAGTTKTGARVRHDCTPGIQQALIDAVAAQKSLWVFYDTAQYFISGPLVTSVDGVNPNCQLYIPKVAASDKMVTLRILGSTPPNMASEGTVAAPRNTQGCIFESTLTSEASGTDPAVLGSSYVSGGFPADRNYINVVIENLIVRTATKNPAGTDIAGTMGAINFKRLTQKHLNNVKIDISSILVNRAAFTNFTFGLYSPEVNNKAELDNGKIYIEGYWYGHIPGEHEVTNHYISLANHIGIVVLNNYYQIFYTKLTAELNLINISLQGTSHIGISSYDTEHGTSGIGFPFEADIKQLSGSSTVNIWQSVVSQSGTGPIPGVTFIASGSPDYTIDHGEGQNRFAAKLIDVALYPTDSLTGYWALENETGNFTDTTGHGFDLTRVNGTTTALSKVDRGANFVAASSQALSGSASNSLSASSGGLAVGGWFRVSTSATIVPLFSKWAGGGQFEWLLYWTNVSNKIRFALSSDGTAFADIPEVTGGNVLADNAWHFVAAIWDGTNIKIYIDGVLVVISPASPAFNTGTAPIQVGNYGGAAATLGGGADELFVYRNALSQEEITLLYNSGVGRHYLEGPNYQLTDTLSSTLVLNRLRLSAEAGADSTIAFFDAIGNLKKGVTFDELRTSVSGGSGYTLLSQFVGETNWTTGYINGSGDYTAVSLPSAGKVWTSNGVSSAPTWETPTGGGDVTKVGTPVNNQLGVWTGDGTIEGDANLTWDGSNLQIGGFADLTVTGNIYAASTLVRAGWLELTEAGAFGVVGTGFGVLWADNTGSLHYKNDANVDIVLGAGGASTFAALTDVNLTSITTNDFLKWDGTDWINRSPSQVRTDLSLVIGTNVQAWDTDLDTWAGVTPASGIATFLATPSSANLRSAITDETGTGGALVFATSPTLTTPIIADLGFISDANGNELLIFDNVASAVNEITISNAATGLFPTISATGETNVNLGFQSKGTGDYLFLGTADGPADIKWFEDTDNGTNYVSVIGQSALGSNIVITLPNAASTLPIYPQQMTYTGMSTARTVTYPDANFTAARTDAAQTFTGAQTFTNAVINTNNAITASGNAATVPVTAALTTVTNNSAATLTITMTTASAVDGQVTTVRILDFSGVAQTIVWVNTENSSIALPTTTNGSTTLPITVELRYNTATTKWRAKAYY